MEKLGQRCSNPHAKPLGHTFTLSPFPLQQQEKSWSKTERGAGIPVPQGSFTFAMQGMGQMLAGQLPGSHAAPSVPRESWQTVLPPSLKMHLEQAHQKHHKTNSPSTAIIQIFNFVCVCWRIKLCSLLSHYTLISGLVSALHFLELKPK